MNTQDKISIVKLAVDMFGPAKTGQGEAALTEGSAPPPLLIGISTGSGSGSTSAANSVNFGGFPSTSSSAGGASSKTVPVLAAIAGVAGLLLLLGKRK